MRRGFYTFLIFVLGGVWLYGSMVFIRQNEHLARLTKYLDEIPVSKLQPAAPAGLANIRNIQPASFLGAWENFKKYLEPPQVFAHPYTAGSDCQWNIQINGPGGGSVREYAHWPGSTPVANLEGSSINSFANWEPCNVKFDIKIEVSGVEPNSAFTGWSGACISGFLAGEGGSYPVCRGTVDMSKPVSERTFIANFSLAQRTLSLSKPVEGYGKGTVNAIVTSGSGSGFSCGPTCSGQIQPYNSGTVVTLTATPESDGSAFYSWSGDCNAGSGGTSANCVVTLTANKFVTAIFKPPAPAPAAEASFTLSVTKSGNGSGVVSATSLGSGGGSLGGGSLGSLGGGINCGSDCSETYKGGSFISVPLSATPDLTNESSFDGWSGACDSVSGNSCVVEFRCGVDDGSLWVKAANLPFTVGVGHKSLIFNNKIWLLKEDSSVRSSSDGVNWTLETASADWLPRRFFGAVVFDDKMWVLGGSGSDGSYYRDIWNSVDGKNWNIVTPSPLWAARDGHAVVVFNNKLWVLGGRSSVLDYFGDVWNSSDGVLWMQATNNDLGLRWNHAAEVFNGKIFVTGGFVYQTGFGSVYQTDVVSSGNGISWQLERSVLGDGIWASAGHTMLVFDNKLWVLGGSYKDALGTVYRNDIWYSLDGKLWTKTTRPWGADWPARAFHNSLVLNGKMWVIGGYNNSSLNEIWYSTASTGGCALTKSVDAKFKAPVNLGVSVTGAGSVNSSPAGIINCQQGSGDCSEIYPLNAEVILQAILSDPSTFVAWTGCSASQTDPLVCSAIMNDAKSVKADFYAPGALAPKFTLDLSKLGPGSVLGPDINCGSGCSQLSKVYGEPTSLTLKAQANPNASFLGWSGDCAGTGDCLVNFACPAQYTLTVEKSGSGSGIITGSQGFGCSVYPCAKSYADGSNVSLVASPNADSVFSGWSGACSGVGSCNLNINSAKTVTVNFETAPTPPAESVSGICLVKSIAGAGATPGFYAPDIGPGYAKLAKPGVNTLDGLKTACTASDYSSLLSNYCTQNSFDAQRLVVAYDDSGSPQYLTCAAIGCEFVSCP